MFACVWPFPPLICDSSIPRRTHKQLEAKSDTKGDYRIEIPGITKPTTISIDAMKPGYRRLVGHLDGRRRRRRASKSRPGKTAEASLVLRPALYFAGIVVDEHGKPIPGVTIAANAVSASGSGGVERTATNSDGSFELFNYSVKPFDLDGTSKGIVYFFHPDYLDTTTGDVYALAPKERVALRIVLESGYEVVGTVFDVAGKPVPNAFVKAIGQDWTHRKATMTDANGKFALRGLGEGLTILSARALDIKQKAQMSIVVNSDQNEVEVRLKAISLPADLKKYTVLGMQLADVTPQLKSAYDLYFDRGAVILDPGKNSDRLNVGPLAEGNNFWMVGNNAIGRSRVRRPDSRRNCRSRCRRTFSVRVVFSFSTLDGDGNNTQYLSILKDDLQQLRDVLGQLTPAKP